ncbi:MAG: 5,6-dimethylbenzimidazole synthase [Pontiella sp.]
MTIDPKNKNHLSKNDRQGLYRTIFLRRDVRAQFLPDPIPAAVLSRVLHAAHHAPSVGFMQPWNFILIKSKSIRKHLHEAFTKAHEEAADMFPEEKRETYRALKLEGILESPLNICITCDRERTGSTVIGRTHNPAMDTYSTVCAVQNLWLAARAEGLGIGWVSIFSERRLKEILELPDRVVPIAYLCIGKVSHFQKKPELETAGWLPRLPLEELIRFDTWETTNKADPTLLEQIERDTSFPKESIR